MHNRRHFITRLGAGAAIAAASIGTVALGESATRPVSLDVVAEQRFSVIDPARQVELVQLVVDFPPGAWTSVHSHGGQAVNLVLEGEITLRQDGVDHAHRAGQGWSDSAGIAHAAGNTGTGKARLLTNFLLPRGALQTSAEGSSPLEPSVLYEARFPLSSLPPDAEIVQRVVDLPSGWRADEIANGFAANLVVAGEVASGAPGKEMSFRAGESWIVRSGTLATIANRARDTARLFTTYLLPQAARP